MDPPASSLSNHGRVDRLRFLLPAHHPRKRPVRVTRSRVRRDSLPAGSTPKTVDSGSTAVCALACYACVYFCFIMSLAFSWLHVNATCKLTRHTLCVTIAVFMCVCCGKCSRCLSPPTPRLLPSTALHAKRRGVTSLHLQRSTPKRQPPRVVDELDRTLRLFGVLATVGV
jgi:hypothetical protein